MRTTCFVLTAVSLLSVAACTEPFEDDNEATEQQLLLPGCLTDPSEAGVSGCGPFTPSPGRATPTNPPMPPGVYEPRPDGSDPASAAVALTIASDDPGVGAPVQTSSFTGSCTPHQGKTAGWADCVGSGTIRLVIDCKAPQISDYVGPWTTFSGSITLSGQCTFGINRVFVQIQ